MSLILTNDLIPIGLSSKEEYLQKANVKGRVMQNMQIYDLFSHY